MTEHVHEIRMCRKWDGGIVAKCDIRGCKKTMGIMEVNRRLNATERLSKSKADTAASLIRGHTVKDDLKAYIRELEGE